jgi:hypothetical protein
MSEEREIRLCEVELACKRPAPKPDKKPAKPKPLKRLACKRIAPKPMKLACKRLEPKPEPVQEIVSLLEFEIPPPAGFDLYPLACARPCPEPNLPVLDLNPFVLDGEVPKPVDSSRPYFEQGCHTHPLKNPLEVRAPFENQAELLDGSLHLLHLAQHHRKSPAFANGQEAEKALTRYRMFLSSLVPVWMDKEPTPPPPHSSSSSPSSSSSSSSSSDAPAAAPSAAEWEKYGVYPPDRDVHCVWISHCLRTEKYQKDCSTQFDFLIPSHLGRELHGAPQPGETEPEVGEAEEESEEYGKAVRLGRDQVRSHWNGLYFVDNQSLDSYWALASAQDKEDFQKKLPAVCLTAELLLADQQWLTNLEVTELKPKLSAGIIQLNINNNKDLDNNNNNKDLDNTLVSTVEGEGGKQKRKSMLKGTKCQIDASSLEFRQSALKDYEKYLYICHLCKQEGSFEQMVNASYKVDLIWHTHMLNTFMYNRDCELILGWSPDHEPWPPRTEQEEGSIKNISQQRWLETFGEDGYCRF